MPHALAFSAMERLTPRELEVLLASAARIAEPGFGAGLTSEDFLTEQSRRIHKAVPRRQRRALEQAAAAYIAAPRVDIMAWRAAVDATVLHAAAVLSDDLAATVSVLQETERELTDAKGIDLIRRSERVRELFLYWVSEDAMALRRYLGLLA